MKENVKKIMIKVVALFYILVVPVLGYSQPPGPGDADAPADVPFDDNMNLVFLLTGVIFAAVIVWQEMKRRKKLQGSNVK